MALSLNVNLLDEGQVRSMRFMNEMTVNAACKIIHEKTSSGGAEYGLFQPGQFGPTKSGRWLRMDKLLLHYDLVSGDEVIYKKKHRSIKVRVLDGSVKMMKADESLVVQDITENVAKKQGIRNWEEYSLKVEGSNPREWLSSTETLHENGVVDPSIVLELRKRYWLTAEQVDKSDIARVRLLFCECRDNVVSGAFPVQKNEAVQLAALQYQADGAVEFSARNYIPPQWMKKKLDKSVMKEHKKVASMDRETAMFRYIKLCRSFATYGVTAFEVQSRIERKGGKKPKIIQHRLCISKDQIVVLDPESNEVTKTYPITNLRRWASGKRKLVLDFGQNEDDVVNFVTAEAVWIAQLVQGYHQLSKRKEERASALQAAEKEEAERTSAAAAEAADVEELEIEELDLEPVELDDEVSPVRDAITATNLLLEALAKGELPTLTDDMGIAVDDDGTIEIESAMEQLKSEARASLRRSVQVVKLAHEERWEEVDGDAVEIEKSIKCVIRRAHVIARAEPQRVVAILPGVAAVSEAAIATLTATRAMRVQPNSRTSRISSKLSEVSVQTAEILVAVSPEVLHIDAAGARLVRLAGAAVGTAVGSVAKKALAAAQQSANTTLCDLSANLAAVGQCVEKATRLLSQAASVSECRLHLEGLVTAIGNASTNMMVAFRSEGIEDYAVRNGATQVDACVDLLRDVLSMLAYEDGPSHVLESELETAKAAIEKMRGASSSIALVEEFKACGLAIRSLVRASYITADVQPNIGRKLVGACRSVAARSRALSDAIVSFVQSGEGNREAVNVAVEQLDRSVGKLEGVVKQHSLDISVRHSLKNTCASACILASDIAQQEIPDTALALSMQKELRQVQGAARTAVKSVAMAMRPSESAHRARVSSLKSVNSLTEPVANFLRSAKAATRTINEPSAVTRLEAEVKELDAHTNKMLECAAAAELAGGTRFLADTQAELATWRDNLESALLKVKSRSLNSSNSGSAAAEARMHAITQISTSAKTLKKALDEATLTVKVSPSNVGASLDTTRGALQTVFASSVTVASETSSTAAQKSVVEAALAAANSMDALLVEMMNVASDPESENKVDQLLRDVDARLMALENEARGLKTKEIDAAIEGIQASSSGARGSVSGGAANVIAALQERAMALHSSISNVVHTTAINVHGLGAAASALAGAVPALQDAIHSATAGEVLDGGAERAVREAGNRIGGDLCHLLVSAKAAAASGNPRDPTLLSAAFAAQSTLKSILEGVHPGITAIIEALQLIKNAVRMLDHRPGDTESVDEAFVTFMWNARSLKQEIAPIPGAATSKKSMEVGSAARQLAAQYEALVRSTLSLPKDLSKVENRCSVLASELSEHITQLELCAGNAPKMLSLLKLIAAAAKECSGVASKLKTSAPAKVQNEVSQIVQAADALVKSAIALGRCTKAVLSKSSGPAQRSELQEACRVALDTAKQLRASSIFVAETIQKADGSEDVVASQLASPARDVGAALVELIGGAKDVVEGRASADLPKAMRTVENAVEDTIAAAVHLAPGAREISSGVEELTAAQKRIDQLLSKVRSGVPIRSKSAAKQTSAQLSERLTVDGHELSLFVRKLLITLASSLHLTGPTVEGIVQATNRLFVDVQHIATSTTVTNEQETLLAGASASTACVVSLLKAVRQHGYIDPRAAELRTSAERVPEAIAALLKGLQSSTIVVRECGDAVNIIKGAAIQISSATAGSSGGASPRSTGEQMTSTQARKCCAQLTEDVRKFAQAVSAQPDQIGVMAKEIAAGVSTLAESIRVSIQCLSDTKVSNLLSQRGRVMCDRASDMLRSVKEAAEASVEMIPDTTSMESSIDVLRQTMQMANSSERVIDAALQRIVKVKGDVSSASIQAASGTLEHRRDTDSLDALSTFRDALKPLRSIVGRMFVSAEGGTDSHILWLVAQEADAYASAVESVGQRAKAAAVLLADNTSQEQLLNAVTALSISAEAFLCNCRDQRGPSRQQEMEGAVDEAADVAREISSQLVRASEAVEHARRLVTKACDDAKAPAAGRNLGDAAASLDLACTDLVMSYGTNVDDFTAALEALARNTAQFVGTDGDGEWKAAVQLLADRVLGALDELKAADGTFNHNRLVDITTELRSSVKDLAKLLGTVAAAELDDGLDGDVEAELQSALDRVHESKSAIPSQDQIAADWTAEDMQPVTAALLGTADQMTDYNARLLESARRIQSSLVDEGRQRDGKKYARDRTWEHGLVSAAKAVSDANADLVGYASKTLRNECGEEMLIASLRLVSAATARLVSSARVKVKTSDEKYKELSSCAKEVTRASQSMASSAALASERRARAAVHKKQQREGDDTFTSSRVQDLEEQARIAKLEMELEAARRAVYQRRQRAYQE